MNPGEETPADHPNCFYSAVLFSGPMEVSDIQVRFNGKTIVDGLHSQDFANRVAQHLNEVMYLAREDIEAIAEHPRDLQRRKITMLWIWGILSHSIPLFGFCVFASEGLLYSQTKPHPLEPVLALLGFGIPLAGCLPALMYYGIWEELKSPSAGIRKLRKAWWRVAQACGLALGAQAILFMVIHCLIALGA